MLEHHRGTADCRASRSSCSAGSRRFTRRATRARLIAEGGREAGRDYYPVVAITHLAWIAAIFLLIPAGVADPVAAARRSIWRCRSCATGSSPRSGATGRTASSRSSARRSCATGPYRYLRHPNYAVTIAETFLLPLVFGDAAVAVIFGCVWSAVLYYKMLLEDAALAERRGGA